MDDYRKLGKDWGSKPRKASSRSRKRKLRDVRPTLKEHLDDPVGECDRGCCDVCAQAVEDIE